MNLNLKTISERRQVAAIIVMAGAAIALLWFFLLLPLSKKRDRQEDKINRLRNELAKRNLLRDKSTLEEMQRSAYKHNRNLHGEWVDLSKRLAAFPGSQEMMRADVTLIDYSVSLSEVRRRLLSRARTLGIGLPDDIGMTDSLTSEDDARKRMFQLKAVEKLVDLALNLKIEMVRSIEPLPPILYTTGTKQEGFLEEYPVKVEFFGSLNNLCDLTRATLEEEHVFALKRLNVMAAPEDKPGLLTVRAVLSSLVFLKDPDDLVPPPKAPRRRGPTGY